MANIVQFENVGLRYGTGPETLSDVNFTLSTGAFYFLTGPSGAGKTSLLKLLYLAQRPTRGVVRLFGEDAGVLPRTRLPGFRRRIGVVFQDFRLVAHLNAYDNIALPLRVAGVSESDIEAPVREMLEWVGLADRGRAKPPTLSGGEQQRVAIARAVIGRPDILVADEPTGNVDPDMAERLLHLFDSLNRLGTTVVVATHDFHLINRIPTAHMMRLEKGRVNDPTGALRNPPGRPWRAAMILRLNPNAADRRLLDEGRRTRAMTWIMAIMVFLTVLAGALGLGMFAATAQLDRQLSGRLTIQIVEPDAQLRDAQAAAVLAALRKLPGVTRAEEADRAHLAELLKPWLGDAGLDPDLPIPAMIDVDARGADNTAIERTARRIAPGARVDRHDQWLSPVRSFMTTMSWLAVGLMLLIATATAAVVLLAARSGLDTHRDTIEVLHMLGSTDIQVARLFQRRIAFDTLVGGLGGTAAALALIWFLQTRMDALGSEMLSGAGLVQRDWFLLLLLPLGFALLATVAARLAVLRALRKTL